MLSILFLALLSITSVKAGAFPGEAVQLHRNFDEINLGCLLPMGRANGSGVGIGDCNGEPGAQAWTIPSGGQFHGAPNPAVVTQIRVFGNMCLDNTNGNVVNGNKLQIWACVEGNTNQLWFVNNNLTISLAGSGKCVDNTNGNTAIGNQAQIWDCDAANPNQQWEAQSLTVQVDGTHWFTESNAAEMQGGLSLGTPILQGPSTPQGWGFPAPALPGQIIIGTGPNLCADVTNGVNADGTRLQMWNCTTGNTNQVFQVRGGPDLWTIHWVGTNKCVDLTNGNASLPVQIWTCFLGNTNQLWGLFPGGG